MVNSDGTVVIQVFIITALSLSSYDVKIARPFERQIKFAKVSLGENKRPSTRQGVCIKFRQMTLPQQVDEIEKASKGRKIGS